MSKAAREVVDGSFLDKDGDELGHILPETEQVIKEVAMPEEIRVLGKKIECEISKEDFISGIKCWKESTLTSPSGCHLGHYKAIVNDPDLKKQDPEIPMEVILDQQSGGNTTTATSLESITLEMCDGRDRMMDRVTKLVQGTKSNMKEITPDKPEEDSLNDMNTFKSTVEGESGTDIQAEGSTIALQDDEMESAEIEGNGDGFCTPTRKHGASATSVAKATTAMEGIIKKDNPYVALMPLKLSRNHGSSTAKSPSGSSPRKKKPKVSPKFMKQMEAQLEKQREEESTINDNDIAISLLG
jgi:hypothetical protein